MFVKKAQQPPVFCSMPGVNNAPLLIITSIDTFPGNVVTKQPKTV